jgi:hypothetical protein
MTYFTVSGISSPFKISIYNALGQEVMHVAGVNQALDLGSLPKGMYLVKILGKEFYGVKKLEKR